MFFFGFALVAIPRYVCILVGRLANDKVEGRRMRFAFTSSLTEEQVVHSIVDSFVKYINERVHVSSLGIDHSISRASVPAPSTQLHQHRSGSPKVDPVATPIIVAVRVGEMLATVDDDTQATTSAKQFATRKGRA